MDLHPKQFGHVNVRAIQGPEGERFVNRHFSVDPRTITLDRLRHLLARALDIRQDFELVWRHGSGQLVIPLNCDWDLEGALSEETRMDLDVRLHPTEPGLEEWDIISDADLPVAGHEASDYTRPRQQSFLEQVFHLRAGPHFSAAEFEALSECPCPLRYAVYRAESVDPSIRPDLWMHLLDVFPFEARHRDKQDFLNRKAEEYYGLRHSWQKLVRAGTIPEVLREITCLVLKDVHRTDRLLDLDEHALYNVLTTYAVHHPSIGYCQGMSDLLSPLLHVMGTEARAYVAFCGLMLRMRDNFRSDGRSICTKFRHLRRAIRTHDPQLCDYLSRVGAMDLLFCYRWLLLDLKREYPYEDMLRLMEVLWATLRPVNSEKGVEMYEVRFPTVSAYQSVKEKIDPKDLLMFTEDYFGSLKRIDLNKSAEYPVRSPRRSSMRMAILRRRQSAATFMRSDETESASEDEDEESTVRFKRRRRQTICYSWSGRDASNHHELNHSNTVHDIRIHNWLVDSTSSRRRHGSSDSNYGSNFSDEEEQSSSALSTRSRSDVGYTSGHDSERTLSHSSETDENFLSDCSTDLTFESAETFFRDGNRLLPPPNRLGDGKPFLVFVCLTMILNHRDVIMSRKMDANEIGIYFDHLVRKHKLNDILPRAKELFVQYLNSGWTEDDY